MKVSRSTGLSLSGVSVTVGVRMYLLDAAARGFLPLPWLGWSRIRSPAPSWTARASTGPTRSGSPRSARTPRRAPSSPATTASTCATAASAWSRSRTPRTAILLGLDDTRPGVRGRGRRAAARAARPARGGRHPPPGRRRARRLRRRAAELAPRRTASAPTAATRTELREGGHMRQCPSCGREHHPRTDPVVIMLVERGDEVLLGRQAAWPPRRYSALAGFVEPGESLEEAVAPRGARGVRRRASARRVMCPRSPGPSPPR